MTSVHQSGWRRSVSGAVSKLTGQSPAANAEILRQMTDVFKELAHLSTDIGALWRSLEDVKAKLDGQAVVLSELAGMLRGQTEFGDESLELLGRLLQSTRARLDVLEETVASVVER